MQRRRVLAIAILAAPLAVLPGGAGAQSADDPGQGDPTVATGDSATASTGIPASAASSGGQTQDLAGMDFVIRPSEDDSDVGDPDEDVWTWQTEPGPSMLETPIGPQILGPSPDDAVGPPLAGPAPEVRLPSRTRKPRPPVDTDPFAARGIDIGSFVIRPSIEVGVSATDNAAGSADKTAAAGAVVAPEINVRSTGERYDFEADARGEGVFYRNDEFNEETAEARAALRYDLSTRTSIYTDAAYSRFLEGFSDPDTPAGAAKRPAVDALAGSFGVEERFGRLSTRVTGFVDREDHEDVTLAGGGTVSRTELNNTEYGLRMRTGYATSASLRPFVEAAVGRRAFDDARDDSGFARSSVWGELRGGLIIDRGEKLSGEASLGYRHEDIEDGRLDDLNVLLANASIVWSPRRLTEVRLDLTTNVNPTSTPGTSATVLYAGTLALARKLTPRVTAEAGLGLSYEDRIGDDWRDVTFTGFADVSYAFNRNVSIVGRYTYSNTDRNEPGGSYDAHEVGVRLRFQR